MGEAANCLLRTGAPWAIKWLVAPVSLMAVVWCWAVGGFGCGVGLMVLSLSSSSKPVKTSNRLVNVVGVARSVEVDERLFILGSTRCGAPPCQARWGGGLMGITVLWTARRETLCPAAAYCATFSRVQPAWWWALGAGQVALVCQAGTSKPQE